MATQFYTIAAYPHGLIAEHNDRWFFVSHLGAITGLYQRPATLTDDNKVSASFRDFGGIGQRIAKLADKA